MKSRVLIADDHQMVRDGLRRLLADQTDMEVVGEAADGREALAAARRLLPHVVVIDVSMPGLNGIEAARALQKLSPAPQVVVLSMHAETKFVVEALRAGALGYVLKDSAFDELVRAIRAVRGNGVHLSPQVAKAVTEAYRTGEGLPSGGAKIGLTDREREILQLLAEGWSIKRISGTLGISVKTAETHRRNIMARLGFESLADLTKYAVREGITRL